MKIFLLVFLLFSLYPIPAFSMDELQNFLMKVTRKSKTNSNEWKKFVDDTLTDKYLIIYKPREYRSNFRFYVDKNGNEFNSMNMYLFSINKETLSKLSFKHLKVITAINPELKQNKSHFFEGKLQLSKDKLQLLNELPDNIHVFLKDYCGRELNDGFHPNSNDYRISFRYRKKLTLSRIMKAIFHSCALLAPCIIPTILHHYYYLEPLKNLWHYIQDPILIEKNKKIELHNKYVENLKENLIPHSEFLQKIPLQNIPFEWIFEDPQKITSYYVTWIINIIIPVVINRIQYHCHLHFFPQPKTEYYAFKDCWKVRLRDRYYRYTLNIFTFLLGTYILSTLLSTKIIFMYGVPLGLIGITCMVSMYNIMIKIIRLYKIRQKIIVFHKPKFAKKPVKEVIEYYLKKKTIEIL